MEPPEINDVFSRLNNTPNLANQSFKYRRSMDNPYNNKASDVGGAVAPGRAGFATESGFLDENLNPTDQVSIFDPNTGGTSNLPVIDVEAPTATGNPGRPRTLAAAYDRSSQKLTVIFPDGTHYNYYGVSEAAWLGFKNRPSKWEYIKKVLDPNYDRGPASVPDKTDEMLDQLAGSYRQRQLYKARKSGADIKFRVPRAKKK